MPPEVLPDSFLCDSRCSKGEDDISVLSWFTHVLPQIRNRYTYTPPPLPISCAKKTRVDCSWIVLIVFRLCRLYLDCMIVYGLYSCGIWHRGCSITYTPLVPKIVPKMIIRCIGTLFLGNVTNISLKSACGL